MARACNPQQDHERRLRRGHICKAEEGASRAVLTRQEESISRLRGCVLWQPSVWRHRTQYMNAPRGQEPFWFTRTLNARPPSSSLMSASSTVSEDTWPPVIAIHRQRLVTLQQTLITNEEDHRKALTQLCSAHRERDATRLLGRIRTQHSPIVDLANAVDSALQHKAQDKLITLVWSVSVAAIRVRLLLPYHIEAGSLISCRSLSTRRSDLATSQSLRKSLTKRFPACTVSIYADITRSRTFADHSFAYSTFTWRPISRSFPTAHRTVG